MYNDKAGEWFKTVLKLVALIILAFLVKDFIENPIVSIKLGAGLFCLLVAII